METVLRQKRIAHHWTLEYVAQNVGVSKQAVHDIETGRRKPSYPVLVALEDLFETGHRTLFAEVKSENE